MILLEQIKSLPDSPGVYQYFDKNNKLLYIGKAKSLKKRVKSYFRFTPTLSPAKNLSPRIEKMILQTKYLNYIVVDSENDALILEDSLVKQLKPKYNILLRDDKTYPYIYINLDEQFPIPEITRKVIKNSAKYFGPFTKGSKEILDTIFEILPLVQSKSCLKGKKACLYYQMQRCLAPCEGKITSNEYFKIIEKAIKYIKDPSTLIPILEQKMEKYAQNLQFENAAEIRDRINAIKHLQSFSNVDLAKVENIDIFYVEIVELKAIIIKIFIRNGKVISTSNDTINLQQQTSVDEIYKRVILEFYTKDIPFSNQKILIEKDFEDREIIEETLSKKFNKKIKFIFPTTKPRKNLISLAKINAQEVIKNKNEDNNELLFEIKRYFNLENIPYKIEVFDTSHMMQEAIVGSKIVYENNKFKKSEYRHYNLSSKDEYSQMRELLSKRIQSFDKISPPDLWVIDGGVGQINIAKELLESVGVNIDIISIAKEKIDSKAHRAKGKAKDIIYQATKKHTLSPNDKKLMFFQKLRDEAHRFAIEFHRKQKRKKDKQIELLSIKGIGQGKIKKLLDYFGTFENIKNASLEELQNVINKKDAQAIKEFYENR